MWCLIADIPYDEDDDDYASDSNDDDDEHEGKMNVSFSFRKKDDKVVKTVNH